jgi:hypothetical protein
MGEIKYNRYNGETQASEGLPRIALGEMIKGNDL